jgi:hypothetical protein
MDERMICMKSITKNVAYSTDVSGGSLRRVKVVQIDASLLSSDRDVACRQVEKEGEIHIDELANSDLIRVDLDVKK